MAISHREVTVEVSREGYAQQSATYSHTCRNTDTDSGSSPDQAENTAPVRLTVRRLQAALVVLSLLFLTSVALLIHEKMISTDSSPVNEAVLLAEVTHSKHENVRRAFAEFVESLDLHLRSHLHYPDASLQESQWLVCTIVQQCGIGTALGEPQFGLSLANMTTKSSVLFMDALAEALPTGAYEHLMMQEVGNLLLFEYQHWATHCAGRCVRAPSVPFMADEIDQAVTLQNKSFKECGALYKGDTTWVCDETPLALYGNLHTDTGRYELNNIFIENEIHARNHFYDFVSVYGDLNGTGKFGFRFSGHHYDVNFVYHGNGEVTTLPAFLGHNPMVVLPTVPTLSNVGHYHSDVHYDLWRNFRGNDLFKFPGILSMIFKAARNLPKDAYVSLSSFESTPQTGGLTLTNGKTMTDVAHIKLSTLDTDDFHNIMAMIDYTHLARNAESHAKTSYTYDYVSQFLHTGRMFWTMASADLLPKKMQDLDDGPFFYIQLETDDLLYFAMMNQLFTLVSPEMPSNHLHSLLIPKAYLASIMEYAGVDSRDHGHDHGHSHGHSHGHVHR